MPYAQGQDFTFTMMMRSGARYGISTVASQLDSVALLSTKLPPGMIRAIFVQGAIAAALFAPLAVLALGKWRGVRFLFIHV